ncbi:MASE1 domain-containing protein [Amycolatopsis sp. lyj-346]|uniref:MASE1 domain-containing protein n=1 Tax=Amycolatopsis sp. lyj-346 TaxID=2789289 RepID=UPI00397807A4
MAELESVERDAGTAEAARAIAGWIVVGLAVALCYYLGGLLGLSLALVRGQVTPFWPSSGIAVVSLLLFGRRAVPGILLGAAAVNAAFGPTAIAVAGITAGNTLAPLLAWKLLTWAGFRPRLERLRDAVTLITLGALGSMVVSAVIGSGVLGFAGAIEGRQVWSTALVWWAGDATGVLVVAPVLLAGHALWRAPRRLAPARRLVEAAGLLVAIGVVAAGIANGQVPVLILAFPFLVWGAWRFGITAAAPCTLILSVAATMAAVASRGPFSDLGLAQRVVILQVFNGSAALTMLLLAAAAAEQRGARQAVELAGRVLETRVRERTAELARTVERLERSENRFTEAQRVGHVGSWERDLVTGRIRWSDEMYRLQGLPPQSAEIDYAAFLEQVHPDDRHAVMSSNEQALRDHRSFESDFRVVWPDRTVHWLRRRGTVVVGESGTPVRMIGTAQDITAAKLAEDALRRSEEKTRTLLASITDAIVGVDGSGRIALVNDRTVELFGYSERDLTGRPVELLLPGRFRAAHEGHREGYLTAPQARPMGVGLDLVGRRKDGTEFPADIALRPLTTAGPGYGGTLVVAAVRDVTERRRAERAAQELRETRLRRRQALEINDTVVQGLTTAVYALERGHLPNTMRTLRGTLGTARQMMHNLLGENVRITAGELIRDTPATLPSTGEHELAPPLPRPFDTARRVRIVLADDSSEIRLALRSFVGSLSGVDIVGEAADGEEAIHVVTERHPDVLLLDLAMPVLDGLQALPRIRRACPVTKIIVLSGYGRDQMAKQSLELGAVAFVEKGGSLRHLADLLTELFPDTIGSDTGMPDDDLDSPPTSAEDDIVAIYAHELRTPIAAAGSMVELLRERIDRLPSPTVNDLLAATARSLRQADLLLRAVTDARKLGEGELDLALEPTDVGSLLHTILGELGELTRDHPVTSEIPAGIVTGLDPLRIRQAFSNLVSNAVKFSRRGAPIEVALIELEDTVEIAVTDHGPGVPPPHQDRLFGKFARFGPDAGIGLGLYICRQISREHGGDTVLADTGPGGTTFALSLPRFID